MSFLRKRGRGVEVIYKSFFFLINTKYSGDLKVSPVHKFVSVTSPPPNYSTVIQLRKKKRITPIEIQTSPLFPTFYTNTILKNIFFHPLNKYEHPLNNSRNFTHSSYTHLKLHFFSRNVYLWITVTHIYVCTHFFPPSLVQINKKYS